MWGVTAWCAATWLRWTLLFALAVLAGWWWLGAEHGGFVLALPRRRRRRAVRDPGAGPGVVQRSPPVLVVVTMTTHPGRRGGQLDLFGNPVAGRPPGNVVPLVESNDVELMLTVAGNAIRCGYLLAGASERVYARDSDHRDEVVRVPRYEDDAVHQLLRRRWLTRGAPHRVTCGAVALLGDHRARARGHPQPGRPLAAPAAPPYWPTRHPRGSGGPAVTTAGRVTRLDDYRRTR